MALLLVLTGGAPAGAQQPAPPKAPARRTLPADVELVPGPAAIPVTGTYTLGFRLRGGALERYSGFPEIDGFKKNGKTSTTTTRIVEGRRFSDLTITQRYMPYGEGDYVIKPFQITVNGVVLRSTGGTVHVGPAPAPPAATTAPGTGTPTPPTGPAAPAASAGTGPLQGVGDLDKLLGKPKPALFQEVPDQAYLAVEAERPSVYVGEGVRVGLFFYLAPADQNSLAFHDFAEQLPRLLRHLHQPTTWQAPGPEPSVTPDTVRVRGQKLLRFRLAENVYYPLTAQALRFPPLALTMLKYKFLKKPEAGTDNRLPGYKTYIAPGAVVQVRPLPPHPQREGVPVGTYRMREALSSRSLQVGQSVTYLFGVEGKGNLSAVLAPALTLLPGVDVYGPEVRETPAPGGGRKVFRYRLVPHRPGRLPLDSLLHLVVFNPGTGRYDTLRPALRPLVRGVAAATAAAARPEDDPFYGPALAGASTELQPWNVYRDVRRYASWLLVGLGVLAAVGWWRAGRRA